MSDVRSDPLIILTWSGEQSRQVASQLKTWLPDVLPGVAAWMSEQDIGKGQDWFRELMTQLSSASASLVIVTPENRTSPWIYYEAGAIASRMSEERRVFPYLVGLEHAEVQRTPLAPLQLTVATREDTQRLIIALDKHCQLSHDAGLLVGNFKNAWPKLDRVLKKLPKSVAPSEEAEADPANDLSAEAQELLRTAAMGEGEIKCPRSLDGSCVEANGKNFVEPGDRRSEATWRSALRELHEAGLVEAMGSKEECFALTRAGYDRAERLSPGNRSAPPAGAKQPEEAWEDRLRRMEKCLQEELGGAIRRLEPYPRMTLEYLPRSPIEEIRPRDLAEVARAADHGIAIGLIGAVGSALEPVVDREGIRVEVVADGALFWFLHRRGGFTLLRSVDEVSAERPGELLWDCLFLRVAEAVCHAVLLYRGWSASEETTIQLEIHLMGLRKLRLSSYQPELRHYPFVHSPSTEQESVKAVGEWTIAELDQQGAEIATALMNDLLRPYGGAPMPAELGWTLFQRYLGLRRRAQ